MTELPQRPEDVREFMDLTFSEEPAELPPQAGAEESMVVRSLRLPLSLDHRLKAVAAQRGVAMPPSYANGSSWG
jgi:hypothetical protein